jgi:head-tail adaptor
MAGIGSYKPIRLEKWAQAKKASGSLGDTVVSDFTVHADIKRTGGGKAYENNQGKMGDVYKVKVRINNMDISALWKMVYRGKRHNVTNIERIDEKNFNYLLTVSI